MLKGAKNMYVLIKRIERPVGENTAIGISILKVDININDIVGAINNDIDEFSSSVIKTDLTIEKPLAQRVIEYTMADNSKFTYEIYSVDYINRYSVLLGVF